MPKVLIVVNNREDGKTLSRTIGRYGHSYECAPSSRISQLLVDDGFVPDVAVIDVGLPGSAGFEAARELRTHPFLAKPHLPIVMISGISKPEYAEECRHLDVQLVSKPCNSATLQGAIINAIQQERDRRYP